MCGIFGVIKLDGTRPTEHQLRRGNNLATHRGPDGEGILVHGSVGLAHRRLAIIDLSDGGRQPMVYRDRWAITFNGEIYNHPELREELAQLGHRFRSRSDTEVVLAAFAEWGDDCFSRFNGMWALAIHDWVEQVLIMSRDRFGKKPLHWARTDREFMFSSEIRQLLPMIPQRIADQETVDRYLSHGLEGSATRTFFANVHRLDAAHLMRVCTRTGHTTKKRFYELTADPSLDRLNEDQACAAVRERLAESVKIRLRSDVLVGMCVSGGLDSSCIAALAAPRYRMERGDRMLAIHARSIETQSDESSHAELIAERLNLRLEVVTPRIKSFLELIDEVVETQEEPFGGPSVLMQYCVMKEAKRLGCKVMLDGQGGDEAFLGYERYLAPHTAGMLRSLRLIDILDSLVRPGASTRWRTRNALQALSIACPGLITPLERTIRRAANPGRWSDPSDSGAMADSWNLRKVQISDFTQHVLPRLLRYEDRNSMRHGVEARHPFLDWNLVELAISLPDRMKIRGNTLKHILRRAMAPDLPHSIAWRRDKIGFEAPERTWIASSRGDMDREILRSRILQGNFSPRQLHAYRPSAYWRLYNVAVWERVFGVTAVA